MSTKKTEEKKDGLSVVIPPVNEKTVEFKIIGTAPYVQLAFSEKAMNMMSDKMKAGSVAKKGTKRAPRDFDDDYKNSQHVSTEGWIGIPSVAFRAAMISACRSVGFQMTKGKLGVFIVADGISKAEGFPLTKIKGTPKKVTHHVRNATGVADLRVRTMFEEWSAIVRVNFDADMFSLSDIANLLSRAGRFVGIGEGRPDSKQSVGMGWGTFRLDV